MAGGGGSGALMLKVKERKRMYPVSPKGKGASHKIKWGVASPISSAEAKTFKADEMKVKKATLGLRNIDDTEANRRYTIATIALLVAVALQYLFVSESYPRQWRIANMLPIGNFLKTSLLSELIPHHRHRSRTSWFCAMWNLRRGVRGKLKILIYSKIFNAGQLL